MYDIVVFVACLLIRPFIYSQLLLTRLFILIDLFSIIIPVVLVCLIAIMFLVVPTFFFKGSIFRFSLFLLSKGIHFLGFFLNRENLVRVKRAYSIHVATTFSWALFLG